MSGLPEQLFEARARAITRANDLCTRAAKHEARGREDVADAIRVCAERAMLDARAITGELLTSTQYPILLAPFL